MSTLWQDLRYGFRSLLKTPGFLVAAVLALGLARMRGSRWQAVVAALAVAALLAGMGAALVVVH